MKKFNLKFYDEDLHFKMKMRSVEERITMQDLIIKACKEYLQNVKLRTKQKSLV